MCFRSVFCNGNSLCNSKSDKTFKLFQSNIKMSTALFYNIRLYNSILLPFYALLMQLTAAHHCSTVYFALFALLSVLSFTQFSLSSHQAANMLMQLTAAHHCSTVYFALFGLLLVVLLSVLSFTQFSLSSHQAANTASAFRKKVPARRNCFALLRFELLLTHKRTT